MAYTARYAHSNTDTPADMTLDAKNDREAVAKVRQFVADGYRNGTWANVELADGRSYRASNKHGKAVGGYAGY